MKRENKTSCSWPDEKIWLFLDQALPAHEMDAFSTHLNSCEACSEAMHEIREVLELARETPGAELSPESISLIAAQITKPATVKPLREKWALIGAGAGLLAAAALLLWMISAPEEPAPAHLLDWDAAIVEIQLDDIDARYLTLKYADFLADDEALDLFQNGADLELMRLKGRILDFEKKLAALDKELTNE